MGNAAKSTPKNYHFCFSRRLRRCLHELFQISSICIFKNDVVGIIINKTSMVSDHEWGWFAVIFARLMSERHKGSQLSFMLIFDIQASVCFEDESVPERKRTLLTCFSNWRIGHGL